MAYKSKHCIQSQTAFKKAHSDLLWIPDPVCLNPSDVTPVMAARLKEPESTSPLQAAEGPRHESQQQEEGSQWEKIKIRALFATMNYILMESKSG